MREMWCLQLFEPSSIISTSKLYIFNGVLYANQFLGMIEHILPFFQLIFTFDLLTICLFIYLLLLEYHCYNCKHQFLVI